MKSELSEREVNQMILGYLVQNRFDHSAFVFQKESGCDSPCFEELEGLIDAGAKYW